MHEADYPDFIIDLFDAHILAGEHGAEVGLQIIAQDVSFTLKVRTKSEDALRVQPSEVFELANSYGRSDLLCIAGVEQKQIVRSCDTVQGAD